MRYLTYKQTYKLTLFGRNDAYRQANGDASSNSKKTEQIAIITTPYITNIFSVNVNSKIYRFDLNHKFNVLAKGSKVILEYARIPAITNSSIHRTIRLCGAEGTNCWDSERGMTANPVLCVYGEAGNTATDVNYFNNDPTFSGLEVPTNFLSKGYIELELSTVAPIGDITFSQAEIDDFCIAFIIYEPQEEFTKDEVLAPEVNVKSLGYKTRVPIINH